MSALAWYRVCTSLLRLLLARVLELTSLWGYISRFEIWLGRLLRFKPIFALAVSFWILNRNRHSIKRRLSQLRLKLVPQRLFRRRLWWIFVALKLLRESQIFVLQPFCADNLRCVESISVSIRVLVFCPVLGLLQLRKVFHLTHRIRHYQLAFYFLCVLDVLFRSKLRRLLGLQKGSRHNACLVHNSADLIRWTWTVFLIHFTLKFLLCGCISLVHLGYVCIVTEWLVVVGIITFNAQKGVVMLSCLIGCPHRCFRRAKRLQVWRSNLSMLRRFNLADHRHAFRRFTDVELLQWKRLLLFLPFPLLICAEIVLQRYQTGQQVACVDFFVCGRRHNPLVLHFSFRNFL